MKKVLITFMAVLAATALVFTSCSDGDDDSSSTTTTTTTTYTFDVTMSTDLTAAASSTDQAACKLGLYYDLSNGNPANLTFTTFSVLDGTTELADSVTSATIELNGTYNYQSLITFLPSTNSTTVASGDTLTVHLVGTSDVPIDDFKGFFVDNSSGATNWWAMLSGYMDSGTGTTAVTE